MTKQQKITLSASRDIPFNKLMLSQSNVRHVKAGVSIEELAEDITPRTPRAAPLGRTQCMGSASAPPISTPRRPVTGSYLHLVPGRPSRWSWTLAARSIIFHWPIA